MNESTLRVLIEAGALRRLRIVADGARFHVEVDTPGTTVVVLTTKGAIKTWSSLDSLARWVRNLGIGSARLELERWQPEQRSLGF
ncbi:MAG TPA: hypothetical protein PKZ77_07505 [Pseudomonadales bacterium]|jgi:hypothetical protein|nr:hypothetical protein [Pseudomonadales bacterium]MCP5319853.1 hypothetical protein [Pseudomonadales bacterium]MCP5337889.1 hypothetical protein [Pseudomonadales bacterium]HMV72156.1 hypothetical protein [Pseudomonadales bacterium]HNC70316.1 hypothetical protein [Pseudomonadales bacterium]